MEVKLKPRIIRTIKPVKRRRTRPVRKWRASEISNLINYLLDNREFEKPSQRVYYLDFIRKYGIDIPWDLIKGKVRNLRTKYEKLRDVYLACDQGENYDENCKIIKNHQPHFDKLAIIFDNRPKSSITNVKDETSRETDILMFQHSNFIDTTNDANTIESFSIKEVRCGQDAKLAEISITTSHLTNELSENFSNPIQKTIQLSGVIKDETQWETNCSEPLNHAIDQQSVLNTSIDSADIINSFNMTEVPFGDNNKNTTLQTQNQHQDIDLTENTIPLLDKNVQQNLEMLKFEFKKQKFLQRMALKEKKFEFKMESVRKKFQLRTVELELEKIKVEKDEHLEKIRLQIDERIALQKMELKHIEGEAEVQCNLCNKNIVKI